MVPAQACVMHHQHFSFCTTLNHLLREDTEALRWSTMGLAVRPPQPSSSTLVSTQRAFSQLCGTRCTAAMFALESSPVPCYYVNLLQMVLIWFICPYHCTIKSFADIFACTLHTYFYWEDLGCYANAAFVPSGHYIENTLCKCGQMCLYGIQMQIYMLLYWILWVEKKLKISIFLVMPFVTMDFTWPDDR